MGMGMGTGTTGGGGAAVGVYGAVSGEVAAIGIREAVVEYGAAERGAEGGLAEGVVGM